jgi:hypothetical protein
VDTTSIEEFREKIHAKLKTVAENKNLQDMQFYADQWASTDMVSLFVFTDAFEGKTSGRRQMDVLRWLDNLSSEERGRIVTFLLLTQKEFKARNTAPPPRTSGTILGFGTTDGD